MDSGEVFAIPNCFIISFTDESRHAHTRVRRVPSHGNDVALLTELNAFCRAVSADPPPLEEAARQVEELCRSHPTYPVWGILLAYIVGGGAYTLFFGGGLWDALCGGLCGLAIGLSIQLMKHLRANAFIRTLVCGAASALCALLLTRFGPGEHLDLIIIGALMILVPGIAFTNSIRDVMCGDFTSGVSGAVEAMLTAVAIALGTGFVLSLGWAI